MELSQIIQILLIIIWSMIFISFIIVEIQTTGIWAALTSVSTIPSLIISIVAPNIVLYIVLQFIIFIVLWFTLYFSVYKLLKNKLVNKKYAKTDFNGLDYDAEYVLTKDTYEELNNNGKYGEIIIGDKKYRTLSKVGEGIINKGEKIKILEVKGNVLLVKKGNKCQ
ncbi:NfeD family protein [Mycoplasmopsis cynos]|uniref:Uncharacterized protein n=2 Tax=Mycoplasmopsis cynos TaxID=171284 RepID=L0RU99_MYCC1|nr:NfeD family protein [Mycoplasmopsis cynos]CCP23878.1 Putative uncharacterized protein MYPU_0850 [Mycoplasmopsis cynos C142]MCU9933590.1 NfeD family protein [Mycoplasmopsis cynos]UWV83230.1 NfeD family protein [Mycoplasmopsis cynos]UWV86090.1 NfeD family protein [Mycoplasmopsis cynos]WAM09460.1 NfeD family protein [Mycoplasmopsis cynos]